MSRSRFDLFGHLVGHVVDLFFGVEAADPNRIELCRKLSSVAKRRITYDGSSVADYTRAELTAMS